MRSDELLTAHPEYLALALGDTSRPRLYRDLLGDEDRADSLKAMREATDGGFPLVGPRLKAQLEETGVRFERATPGPRADPSADEPAAGQLAFLTE